MRVLLSAMLLLAGTIPAVADPLVAVTAPAALSIESDGDNFRVTSDSQRYQTIVLPWYDRSNAPIWQLLDIHQHNVAIDGPQADFHYLEANTKVTVYPLNAQGKGPLAYTIEAPADSVTAYGGFLTLTRDGCCIEQPTHAIYSLLTGEYLFNATGNGPSGQWANFSAQGTYRLERYIAAHVRETAADAELFASEPNGAAIISYADQGQPLQRLMLVIPVEAMAENVPHEWYPQLDLVSDTYPKGTHDILVDHVGDPATVFGNASVRLQLDDATAVQIPITADRLDLKAAKLPAGYKLVEIPL